MIDSPAPLVYTVCVEKPHECGAKSHPLRYFTLWVVFHFPRSMPRMGLYFLSSSGSSARSVFL